MLFYWLYVYVYTAKNVQFYCTMVRVIWPVLQATSQGDTGQTTCSFKHNLVLQVFFAKYALKLRKNYKDKDDDENDEVGNNVVRFSEVIQR